MTLSNMTFDYKVSLFLCLYNNNTKDLLLPNISISNVLRVMMIEYRYAMNKTDLGVQAHQSLILPPYSKFLTFRT